MFLKRLLLSVMLALFGVGLLWATQQPQQIVAGTEQIYSQIIEPMEHQMFLLRVRIMSLEIENQNLKERLKARDEHKEETK